MGGGGVGGREGAGGQARARVVAGGARGGRGVEPVGGVPGPWALLRGRYRYRLLVKASREAPLQRLLRAWLADLTPRRGLRVRVDIDPYSFL